MSDREAARTADSPSLIDQYLDARPKARRRLKRTGQDTAEVGCALRKCGGTVDLTAADGAVKAKCRTCPARETWRPAVVEQAPPAAAIDTKPPPQGPRPRPALPVELDPPARAADHGRARPGRARSDARPTPSNPITVFRERRAVGEPVRTVAVARTPKDRRPRPKRWTDAVDQLRTLQAEYGAWRDQLPESLADSRDRRAPRGRVRRRPRRPRRRAAAGLRPRLNARPHDAPTPGPWENPT